MAKPTTVIARPPTTPEGERATALASLRAGASDQSDALLEGLALLQALHERGVLEALVAFFQQGDGVLGVTMDTLANQPAYTQGAKNAMTLAQSLGELDEPTVATTQRMVSGGLRAFATAKPPARPLGFFDVLRALKDPDVSAGLTAVIALLKGFGAAQRQRSE
jgi:uncharacterized protein YjgD (DUF1641 family)